VRIEVTDDSGFLALADPDAYEGFIGDWDYDSIMERFQREMAARRVLVWGSGQEGCWTVAVSLTPSTVRGEREALGSIVCTKGRLLVTNYESLTTAAQFDDVTLPEPHQLTDVVEVPPGSYRCRVVQVSRRAHNWDKAQPPEFVIELEASSNLEAVWPEVPWADDQQ
jgi:hypothetical protein